MSETYYYHAIAVNRETDKERDLYAHGDEWVIDDAFVHFAADLGDDEELILVEEIDESEQSEKEES
ncbi:hypothetical protein C4587_01885 [Candidatus Parcubacteria bacterium]|nr:MAG: hypothetical protein C4587_01885 [Candidatus Parcubacteria bacterium]